MIPERYPSPDGVRDCDTLIVVATQAEAKYLNQHPAKAPSTLYVGQLRQLYGIRVKEAISMVSAEHRSPQFQDWWYSSVLCRVYPR